MIGKTVCDELFYSFTGANAHYGTPKNIRAPGRMPGGSSSGSAAATAAGLSAQALATVKCLSPAIPAMVIHSKNDGLFKGYGPQARDWWVKCNGCGATGKAGADGCLEYPGCTGGAGVQFCETSVGHGTWVAGLNASILTFFSRFARKQ